MINGQGIVYHATSSAFYSAVLRYPLGPIFQDNQIANGHPVHAWFQYDQFDLYSEEP